jgi:hypothetical protein
MEIHDNERRFSPHRDLAMEFLDEMSHRNSDASEEEEEELPPPAPLSSDCSDNNNNETFDTLDDFGEDTLHCLMDSDLRLGTVPPLSSLRENHRGDADYDEIEIDGDEKWVGREEEEAENKFEKAEPDLNDSTEEDDYDNNTASESLLRGPLMAAKSFASMNQHHTAAVVAATAGGHLFDKKRTIDSTTAKLGKTMTPSTARSTFLSAKKDTPYREQRGSVSGATPSNLIIDTTVKKKPPLSAKSSNSNPVMNRTAATTPSMIRQQFLNSPQDSISTIGSSASNNVMVLHTTHRVRNEEGDTPGRVRGGFVSPTVAPGENNSERMFTFDNHDMETSIDDAERIASTPTSRRADNSKSIARGINDRNDNGVERSNSKNAPTPQSVLSNHTAKSSLGRRIALGEEQMMKQQQQAAPPTGSIKKSFLKKGTRKEPSALHTLGNHQQLPTANATYSTNTTSESSNLETPTARKERLARLEKMQQDLLSDYQKREQRKEEAQRERRRLRMVEMGKRGVATKCGGGGAVEDVKKAKENPSPVPGGRAESDKMACNTDTIGNGEKKNVAALSPTADRAVKQARRNVREMSVTPSRVRAAQTPTASIGWEDEKKFQSKNNDETERFKENDEADVDVQSDADEWEAVESKSKPIENKQVKHTAATRHTRSVSRPKTAQSKPATNSLSPKRNSSAAKKANNSTSEQKTEDWTKKETEEWALIKNMRRRQEAALREAEGERERVSLNS